MGQIRVLPPTLISRIAAGECIERPASVVKELVENALDAGAREIDIELADGGRGLIAVRDDGVGMGPEDLTLSVQQHATSKLVDDDDLFNIRTMGFRGEALASIAAVARVRIVSRRREAEVAHELTVEGGRGGAARPCAAPCGTTVEVRDLFYSVPARRKFLRTHQTEMGHVSEQLARVALARPEVAFRLRHQGRVTHQLGPTNDPRQRIGDFYGPELAAVLLPIRRAGQGVVVEGLVAPPAESRGSNKWEYLFVNGRYVRDRFVSHAVKEAYRSLVDPARFPVVFLFLQIDPALVDVNVHPTKIEVRWQDSNYVHGQVLAALRERFLTSNLDHALRTPREDDEYRARVRSAMVDFLRHGGRPAGGADWRGGAGPVQRPASDPTGWPAESAAAGREARPALPAWYARSSGVAGAAAATGVAPPAGQPFATEARAGSERLLAPLPVIVPAPAGVPTPALLNESGRDRLLDATPQGAARALQVHNTYLVVETPDGVMLVDQHALHERILYEELRARLTERRLESQRLLLPCIVAVPPDRLEALEAHAETLARLGIELAPAGPQSVALHAFPTLLLELVDSARFVRDLLDLLGEKGARPDPDTLLHELLDMMACKAAVKAGDPLAAEEITALLQRRGLAERSSHCPHGRPTTLHLSLRELERQFHRR